MSSLGRYLMIGTRAKVRGEGRGELQFKYIPELQVSGSGSL